ncbi:MAG: hypothetical protein COA38_12375 [Fluviicola sp.]|nr:MAG: hypothetical protein COA38_12375 [Fluviicola sp.]
MKTEIETVKEFRIRHEDLFFLGFLLILSLPFNGIFFGIANSSDTPSGFLYFAQIMFNILIIGTAVFHAWYYFQIRKEETAYVLDGRIIKKQNAQVIFDYPMNSIVSVRIQNKKGIEGTIILFTNQESLKYFIAYGLNNGGQLSTHGFTDYKISCVKNRKWLLTEIYKVNPKLHFIESF